MESQGKKLRILGRRGFEKLRCTSGKQESSCTGQDTCSEKTQEDHNVSQLADLYVGSV